MQMGFYFGQAGLTSLITPLHPLQRSVGTLEGPLVECTISTGASFMVGLAFSFVEQELLLGGNK